jgi:hypothetical protein
MHGCGYKGIPVHVISLLARLALDGRDGNAVYLRGICIPERRTP